MKKTTQILSLVFITSLLTACHENPLKTNSKSRCANFLIETSHQAEKEKNIHAKTERSAWLACMRGKEKGLDCKSLFAAMINVAKSSGDKDFDSLNQADLAERAVFARLEERYEELLFNTLFED
jgi:hypothetical protein